MVFGDLSVPVIPQIGDELSLGLTDIVKAHRGHPETSPFTNMLTVTHRIINANTDSDVMIMLEDITAETEDDAVKLAKLFQEIGLDAERWSG